jgi:SAM-dependent methyltransferase
MEIRLLIAIGYPANSQDSNKKERQRLPFERFASWNCEDHRMGYQAVSFFVDDWDMADIVAYRERLAPVYLYQQHYRLQSFSDAVIYSSVERCLKILPTVPLRILDLCSYDGSAIRVLARERLGDDLVVSDHLPYIGKVLVQDEYHPSFADIATDHHIDLPSASCDVVTCFHKLEFTPKWEQLVREAVRVLRPGGLLYISTLQPSLARHISDLIRYRLRSPKFRLTMYDGNPYYKIGPFARRSFSSICNVVERFDMKRVEVGMERVSETSTLVHSFAWGMFKKQ